ncbi:MAG: DUF1697 domain-containing protein [Gaiellaceae bacterium]
MRYVVLLRGVNVGGNRRLPMHELRATLAAAGFRDVRTHLQSGNAILDSSAKPARLVRELEALLGVQVVVRTRDELADVVARDPFGETATNGSRFFVTFLSGEPKPVAGLESGDGELFVVSGREVYSWLPEGIRDSQRARLLTEGRLGVVPTTRNWNTVTKLLELAR